VMRRFLNEVCITTNKLLSEGGNQTTPCLSCQSTSWAVQAAQKRIPVSRHTTVEMVIGGPRHQGIVITSTSV
jgi:hypothetical protein